MVIEHLSEVYNFDIEYRKRNQTIYEIHIQDSLKLIKYLSNAEDHYSSNITLSSNKITLENVTLKQIAQELTSKYSKYIDDSTDFQSKFDFIIPNNNLKEVINILNQDYGILLKETEKELEYILVNFEK